MIWETPHLWQHVLKDASLRHNDLQDSSALGEGPGRRLTFGSMIYEKRYIWYHDLEDSRLVATCQVDPGTVALSPGRPSSLAASPGRYLTFSVFIWKTEGFRQHLLQTN